MIAAVICKMDFIPNANVLSLRRGYYWEVSHHPRVFICGMLWSIYCKRKDFPLGNNLHGISWVYNCFYCRYRNHVQLSWMLVFLFQNLGIIKSCLFERGGIITWFAKMVRYRTSLTIRKIAEVLWFVS